MPNTGKRTVHKKKWLCVHNYTPKYARKQGHSWAKYSGMDMCQNQHAAYDAHQANYTLYNIRHTPSQLHSLQHTTHTKPTTLSTTYDTHLANYTLYNIRHTPSQLLSLQQIPTQHDMLPQHLVYKNELNLEM